MKNKKQDWKVGDLFAVKINNGQMVVAQIVGREAEVLNSVSVSFFDILISSVREADSIKIDPKFVFSTVFSTRDLLDSGVWQVIGNRSIAIPSAMLPHEDKRKNGFVGAKVIGSGILTEFLNAYYALVPWDDWKEPNYLDHLLCDPSKKPKLLIFKKSGNHSQ